MLLYKGGLGRVDKDAIKCKVNNFTFSKYTTYGAGGAVDEAYFPKTVIEAKTVYDNLLSRGVNIQVIGNGSNILASDKPFGGAVISTRCMTGIIRLGNNRLLCLAGTKISDLLGYCRRWGYGGLEYLYGIPATVGGAVYMNAGVSGSAIGADVENVHVYNGESKVFKREICNFSYRHSIMRDINAIILSIILKVKPCSVGQIDDRIEFYRQRRKHLPKGKSCGCVFKNPPEGSAGQLIEAAGLKGVRIGNAEVSPLHANFIINYGSRPQDVKSLIQLVKQRVYEKFAILLEEEVVYIGDF